MFEDFAIKIKKHHKRWYGRRYRPPQAVEQFALNYGKRQQSGMRSSERIVLSKMGENRNPSNCETVLLTLFIETFLK